MARHDWEYENAQEAIRDTAARLFCANGVHATSLGDIAQEIKLSKGTLYYYYPSKDYLVQEIAQQHLMEISAILFDWLDNVRADYTVEDLVQTLAQAMLEDERRLALHYALNAEAVQGNQELRIRFARQQKEWAVLVEMAATKLSNARGAPLRSRSEALLCLIEGCGWRKLIGEAPDAQAIALLFSGFSS